MPAAAVIPAPIAYINVVAVKKLVVGSLALFGRPAFGLSAGRTSLFSGWRPFSFFERGSRSGSVTLKKFECSKQAYAVKIAAWNNKIGLSCLILLVLGP